MSLADRSLQNYENTSRGVSSLTPGEKAALRERVARLKTPEEMAALLDELRDAAAEIVIIGQRLLASIDRNYPSDNTRFQ